MASVRKLAIKFEPAQIIRKSSQVGGQTRHKSTQFKSLWWLVFSFDQALRRICPSYIECSATNSYIYINLCFWRKSFSLFLAVDMSGNHSMIICSEEQFKVLTLPQLRIKHKEKLTAIDGSKVRKLGVISLRNQEGRVLLHAEAFTPLETLKSACFQGGDWCCLGHLYNVG